MKTISNFLHDHFPIWYINQPFCLIVLGLMLATFLYWFHTRSKPSLVIIALQVCYLLPFVRA